MADERLEDRWTCLDAAKHRLEPVDLVVDGPSLVPPGGAGLDQWTEQIAGAAGGRGAGPAEDDLEWTGYVAVAVTTDICDQVADLVDRWGVAVPGGQEQRAAPSQRAARRIGARCGQNPPIQTGTRGRCIGRGSRVTSWTR